MTARKSLDITLIRKDGQAKNSLELTLTVLRDAGFTLSPVAPQVVDTGCGDWVHVDVEYAGDIAEAVEQVSATLCIAGIGVGRLMRPWGTVPFEIRVPCRRNDGQKDNTLIQIHLSIERAGFNVECVYVVPDSAPRIVGATVSHAGDIDAACAQVEAALCVTDIRDLETI